VELAPLRFVDVQVCDGQNIGQVVSGLYDSGAEIALVHPRVLEGLSIDKCGNVSIRSAIGDCITCCINIRAVEIGTELNVLCAVTEKAYESLILTADVDRLNVGKIL
jgi:hypothetical protein